jgi:hypothetical protein
MARNESDTASSQFLESARLVDSFGELAGKEWDHAVSLTHRFQTSTDTSVTQAKRFVRRLENVAGGAVNYFGAVENGALNDRAHLHLVLQGTADLAVSDVARAWDNGFANVRIYDPTRGFVAYAAKNLPSGDAELLYQDRRKAAKKAKRFTRYHPAE